MKNYFRRRFMMFSSTNLCSGFPNPYKSTFLGLRHLSDQLKYQPSLWCECAFDISLALLSLLKYSIRLSASVCFPGAVTHSISGYAAGLDLRVLKVKEEIGVYTWLLR